MSDVARRLAAVLESISAAQRRAGRTNEPITLVAASKGVPVPRLQAAYDAGLRHFGENKVQEAREKVGLMPGDVTWHMIGRLQRNKANMAARLFSTVHSVDRMELVKALEGGCAKSDRQISCYVQVDLAGEPQKGGAAPGHVDALVDALLLAEHLRPVGLMVIPPNGPPEVAREIFLKACQLRDRLLKRYPMLTELSMGMSADYEVAVEAGATLVRVGTALFGPRQP